MVSRVYMLCDAYESGIGHGLKQDGHDNAKHDLYAEAEMNEAYCIGYAAGVERRLPPHLTPPPGLMLSSLTPEPEPVTMKRRVALVGLRDGQKRVMRPAYAPDARRRNYFQVTAYREDCDTPYVILKNGEKETYLEDSMAHDLANRIMRALSILPSSK